MKKILLLIIGLCFYSSIQAQEKDFIGNIHYMRWSSTLNELKKEYPSLHIKDKVTEYNNERYSPCSVDSINVAGQYFRADFVFRKSLHICNEIILKPLLEISADSLIDKYNKIKQHITNIYSKTKSSSENTIEDLELFNCKWCLNEICLQNIELSGTVYTNDNKASLRIVIKYQ